MMSHLHLRQVQVLRGAVGREGRRPYRDQVTKQSPYFYMGIASPRFDYGLRPSLSAKARNYGRLADIYPGGRSPTENCSYAVQSPLLPAPSLARTRQRYPVLHCGLNFTEVPSF